MLFYEAKGRAHLKTFKKLCVFLCIGFFAFALTGHVCVACVSACVYRPFIAVCSISLLGVCVSVCDDYE